MKRRCDRWHWIILFLIALAGAWMDHAASATMEKNWVCPSSPTFRGDVGQAVTAIAQIAGGGVGPTYIDLVSRERRAVELALADIAKTMGLIREGLAQAGFPLRGIYFEWSVGVGESIGDVANQHCDGGEVGIFVKSRRRR